MANTPTLLLTFSEMIAGLTKEGAKATRESWPDQSCYIRLKNDQLVIFLPADGLLHPLTVHINDVLGTDWYFLSP